MGGGSVNLKKLIDMGEGKNNVGIKAYPKTAGIYRVQITFEGIRNFSKRIFRNSIIFYLHLLKIYFILHTVF